MSYPDLCVGERYKQIRYQPYLPFLFVGCIFSLIQIEAKVISGSNLLALSGTHHPSYLSPWQQSVLAAPVTIFSWCLLAFMPHHINKSTTCSK